MQKMNLLQLKKITMNKKIYYTLFLLFLGGCTTKHTIKTSETFDMSELDGIYYQAYDYKWRHDPGINPVFDNKSEAEKYAITYNHENSHMYIVRMINYRYEIRNADPHNNEMIYTSNDFNDAVDFVDEYKDGFNDLVLYDLKTGRQYE